ncbi:hypothetical protein [Aquimarina sp. 2304DJ70-9]|uniref:hypothetical protein n=1 Tax=Aquimarina penaris TaxID=3231044 RepID=UPI00346296F2
MKIKLKLIIVILGVSLIQQHLLSQEGINKIVFNYTAPGVLVNPKISKLDIIINKTQDDVIMQVYIDKMTMKDYAEKKAVEIALENAKTKEDSLIISKRKPSEKYSSHIYELTFNEFDNIVNSIVKIQPTEISRLFPENAVDGYSCSIEFGGYSSSITYNVWSPSFKTKKRGIQSFLESCKLILSAAGVNSRKIL